MKITNNFFNHIFLLKKNDILRDAFKEKYGYDCTHIVWQKSDEGIEHCGICGHIFTEQEKIKDRENRR